MSRFNTTNNNLRQKNGSSVSISVAPQTSDETQKSSVQLMCFDLTHSSRSVQFILLTLATFFFYLIYGYMQELIFRLNGFRPYGMYLTLIQFLYYVLFGIIELLFKQDRKRKIPIKTYTFLAFLTVSTMGLSNTSVGYLNYATQVIFKCCKLIPVLIGGILIQGKRYNIIDFSACICMSLGLILFTLADSTIYPEFNLFGIVLISLAVCADGVIGNVQEKNIKQHGASNCEVVLYSYGIGFFYILGILIISGQLYPAFLFCNQYPKETYGYAVIFSITGYLGVNIVLTLVKSFGALTAVTVTTCRKAITIILSFIFFSKPFTLNYLWSGCIVLLGIYLNLYSKNQQTWNQYFSQLLRTIGNKGVRTKYVGVENIV